MDTSVQIKDSVLAGGASAGGVLQFIVIIVSIIPQCGAVLSV
jgi:hypothetical protein